MRTTIARIVLIILSLFLIAMLSSCSIKVNLSKEQRRDIAAHKFSRFKISPKEVAWNTSSFFVGYSIRKELRKKID